MISIIGANASGKTTLIEILSGIIRPDEGALTFPAITGENVNWVEIKNNVIYVDCYQNVWERTLLENLQYAAASTTVSPTEAKRLVDEYLFKFHLVEYGDAVWGEMTAGIRARVELVRALLLAPKLLVLDEPVAHTDPYWTLLYMEELYRLTKSTSRPMAVLFSSHNIYAAEIASDKVLVLDRGRQRFFGNPADLDDLYGDTIIEFDAQGEDKTIRDILRRFSPTKVDRNFRKYRVTLDKETSVRELLTELNADF